MPMNNISTNEGSALVSCIINLVNTIVGAGMLGLPGAFAGVGYIGGTVLTLMSALFSAHGLVLLSKSASATDIPCSFYSVANAAVPGYTSLIDIAVALKCFGVATGYFITVGDCMVDALDHILLTGDAVNDDSFMVMVLLSRRFWVCMALCSVLPISFFRTLDSLKNTSALALVFVFMLATGIVAYANDFADPCLGFDDDEECIGQIVPYVDIPSMLKQLPIFVFSFTCQQNIFPIVNEMQNVTAKRMNIVIVSSIGFALVLFLVVAIEGYLTYGANVRGDLLLNYPETVSTTVMRISIAFMLILHYPLQLDPSRRCLLSLIKTVKQKAKISKKNDENLKSQMESNNHGTYTAPDVRHTDKYAMFVEEDYDLSINGSSNNSTNEPSIIDQAEDSNNLFIIITITFLFLSFCVAMIVDDLGVILAIVGATGSAAVTYILPGLIYIKIHPSMDTFKACAYLQLYLGCIIIPTALYSIFQ